MFKNIFIETGPINSGKTTRLMEWCKNRNDVYGILTPKINGKRVFVDVATGDQFEMEIWVKQNDDLYIKSNERFMYKDGFQVLEISAEPDNSYIDFNFGRIKLGQEQGGIKEDIAS